MNEFTLAPFSEEAVPEPRQEDSKNFSVTLSVETVICRDVEYTVSGAASADDARDLVRSLYRDGTIDEDFSMDSYSFMDYSDSEIVGCVAYERTRPVKHDEEVLYARDYADEDSTGVFESTLLTRIKECVRPGINDSRSYSWIKLNLSALLDNGRSASWAGEEVVKKCVLDALSELEERPYGGIDSSDLGYWIGVLDRKCISQWPDEFC